MIRFRLLLVVLLGLVLTACQEGSPQGNTFVPNDKPCGISLQRIEKATPQIKIFTSNQYYSADKQPKILPELLKAINGGKYDITQIQTSYKFGYLVAVRMDYLTDGEGDGSGKHLRLKYLTSYGHYDRRDKEVKAQLEVANATTPNILEVQTVFVDGYLLAAEIWYREE